MKNAVIAIVAVVVIIIGIFFMNRGKTIAPTITNSVPVAVSRGPVKTVAINYVNGALSIKTVIVNTGDTVLFVNADAKPHWPASDPHPAHTNCPGFDALHALANGQSYAMTFHNVGVCTFHDHSNPSAAFKGTITVQ